MAIYRQLATTCQRQNRQLAKQARSRPARRAMAGFDEGLTAGPCCAVRLIPAALETPPQQHEPEKPTASELEAQRPSKPWWVYVRIRNSD
jgi:hypothetical protein